MSLRPSCHCWTVYINTGLSSDNSFLSYTCFLSLNIVLSLHFPSLSKTSFLPRRHIAPTCPPPHSPSLFRSPFCQIPPHLCDRRTHSEEAKSLFRHSLPRLRRFITVSNEQLDSEKWARFPQFKKRISTGASDWGLRILHSLIKFNEQPHFSWKILDWGKSF